MICIKNDIKELIKKNNINNSRALLIVTFSLSVVLFIGMFALFSKDYNNYAYISLIGAVIFLILGIVIIVRANKTDWDVLDFDMEKEFCTGLLYSDNYLALTSMYIMIYNEKKIFRLSDILFIFVDKNVLKLYLKDNINNIYSYNFRYSNSSTFNNICHILKSKCFDANTLLKDCYLTFSSYAFFDINRFCTKEVILLDNVLEVIRGSQNEILIVANFNGKTVTGSYQYNNIGMCNQTFMYLANNCRRARIYNSLADYNGRNGSF